MRQLQRTLGNRRLSALAEGDPEDRGGMPARLRAGLEALSGEDLSAVRVHRNSPEPARLDALAYARGREIHLAPGEERQLPHEGWHAVQQMQGRVRPTRSVGGVPINDDEELEREAGVMGAKALRAAPAPPERREGAPARAASGTAPETVQRAMKFEIQTRNPVWMVDRRGRVKPVPRKYGARGKTEKGEEQFLTTGVAGRPHVRRGDFVEAKDPDPELPAQYVWTYPVIDEASGRVGRPKKKRNRGKVNRGTYELRYVDSDGNTLDVHRDGFGRFRPGRGPLMRRARRTKEGSAVELQAEDGGFVEFESPKWHRRWSALETRMNEARAMTLAMDAAPVVTDQATLDAVEAKIDRLKQAEKREEDMGTLREWPASFRVEHLPVIRRGGRLLVEIVDPTWFAGIQVSESLALQQFESLLKEHERPAKVVKTLDPAREIFDALKPASPAAAMLFEIDHSNLLGLLQMIVYYIVRGQGFSGRPKPAKAGFRLMSRTSFYSIYRSLLSKDERKLFRRLVRRKAIPAALGLRNSDRVLKKGHGGASARARHNPTIGAWLVSVYKGGGRHPDRPGRRTDLMSRPARGSAAMGRFDVDTREGKKQSGLIRIEVRGSEKHLGGNGQPRARWLLYLRKVFEHALAKRGSRPGLTARDAVANELRDE